MNKFLPLVQLYLRLSIAAGYIIFGLDRLGAWGRPGQKNISWGDWSHFMTYAAQVMSFLPYTLAVVCAAIATGAEIIFGILLAAGKWTYFAAIGSGILALLFAVSMAISFGILSPLTYSVFTLSAGSFALACLPAYKWSLDNLSKK